MRITLGVTGGVAAYKAAELVRRLQQEGFSVEVVMTRAACEFITPLTFAALTGKKVITGLFAQSGGEANLESAIEHIAVAQRTDLLLVAPATADIIAKFSRGISDDFLSTLYLATTAPVVVAPAMNVNMWNHPATQENLERLRGRGVHVVNPNEGYLETVLLTAGPTQEDLDPVRFLTNRSSGRMGYAVAEAAAQRGAKVILVTGPTALDTPAGVTRVNVRSASEMLHSVEENFSAATIAIFAAAVADYRPADAASQKIKKTAGDITLRLEPNPDILAIIARKRGHRLIVGFAAETDKVAENACKKLTDKNADLIVANDVTAEGAGFDVDTNIVTLFARDGRDLALPKLTKREVAHRILDEVVRLTASVKHLSAD